ncbi:MAG: NAD-dependent epimerase [Helicobacteraceae bacterium]|jgi:UDP-glucuronate 4-epimerase|nr:NAD-dependent epimerase [Helicobacteraceae bacterium]
MKILVTGTAGFIGFHAALRLLDRGDEVIGLDNVNDYYDQRLKYGRLAVSGVEQNAIEYGKLAQSKTRGGYRFIKLDLTDKEALNRLFEQEKFDRVCHLAAQAGVRYSLTNPHAYVSANIEGTLNILEACRFYPVEHLTYASSSSVYGLNEAMPFNASNAADHPISLYAASKKSCEMMAHTYSHLFGLSATGLRFFTVYGPWGRPDMALFIFVKAILEGKPIDVFNNGEMKRDFTYIDDIVEGVIRVIDTPAASDPRFDPASPNGATSSAPHRIYNIGRGSPELLTDFIEAIENALGKKAIKNYLPMQPGDVPATFADTSALERDLGYKPSVLIQSGVDRFVKWYRDFYKV